MLGENAINVTTRKIGCIVQKCALCSAEVELVCGAVIYGDQWYHSSCWESSVAKK